MEEEASHTLPSQADKKPRKKKKKKGGDGGAGDGDGGAGDGDGGGIEAVANTDGGGTEAAGTEAAGAGKSASQLKREKQKAAAARKKAAAAAAAAAPDIGEIFSARHETGPEGLSFDEATAALLTASAETAHGVAAADAADALLRAAQAEVDALVPGTNPKLLPKALKWCSTNAVALCSLLDLPAASGGSGAVRPTLGLARLRLLQLLVTLVSAKRPVLSSALAACQPPPASRAATLLEHYPAASLLQVAALALVRASLLGGSRALREATLSGSRPFHHSVVAALAPEVARGGAGAGGDDGAAAPPPRASPPPLRPFWIEAAVVIEAAAAADKRVASTLAASGWSAVAEALPSLQRKHAQGTLCGPPPPRPLAPAGQGEMAELIAALQRIQQGEQQQ